jgi:alpha-beta hydrolase superfamily lysophospholipase
MRESDFYWRTTNQLKINGRLWTPSGKAEAVLAVLHGMGEHIGRYRNMAQFWTTRNIAVIGHDHIGHGKSEGKRGHVFSYKELINGVEELIYRTNQQFPNVPVVLYGHSMGGNVAINYLLRKPFSVKGAIITSPYLKLAFKPSEFKVKLAHIMLNLYPGFSQSTKLDVTALSRDETVVKAYKKDKYVHDKITASMFVALHKAGLYALQHADELKVPVLLMHGTADQITSFEATQQFAVKANIMSRFIPWPDFYHEIHNEPGKEEVMQAQWEWIQALLNQNTAE